MIEGSAQSGAVDDRRTSPVVDLTQQKAQAEALLKQRRFRPALNLLARLHSQAPDDASVLYMLAVAQRIERQFSQAKTTLEHLAIIAPEYGRAWQEWGHLHRDQNKLGAAIEAYQRAVQLNPGLIASWRFLAKCLREAGEHARAELAQRNYQRLEQLPPELVSVTSMMHERQLYKAERLCRHFLNQHPHHLEAMRLLAAIGVELHVYDDAEFLLESALEFDPQFDLARLDYVQVLHKRQKYEQAFGQAERLRRGLPGNPSAELAYANQCAAIGRHEEALHVLDDLIERLPDPSGALLAKGHALKTIGRSDEAIAAYRQACQAQPRLGDAYWSLANMKTFRFSDEEVTTMLNQVRCGQLTQTDEIHFCFALGKALEDLEDYAQSFQFYRRGNEAKQVQLGYDPARMEADFERQKTFFTPERAARLHALGDASHDPIFVVGLPRAGSTLIEQILASHSLIDGTLELPNILALVHRLNGRLQRGQTPRYPAILDELAPHKFAEFGRQYLDQTRIHRVQAPHFTDKMPNNFRHIGLILSILPNARVIDARRGALDCCLSGYKQLFAEGQEFTYSLENIGRYYQAYVDLMKHWQGLYPDRILRVDYERVVDDLDTQVHRLLDFLSLPFESACVEFHQTERSVRTASAEQVRQPIYRSGMEHWRNYQPWLQPLQRALGEAAVAPPA